VLRVPTAPSFPGTLLPLPSSTAALGLAVTFRHLNTDDLRPSEQTTLTPYSLHRPLPPPSGEPAANTPTQFVPCPPQSRALITFAPSHDPP